VCVVDRVPDEHALGAGQAQRVEMLAQVRRLRAAADRHLQTVHSGQVRVQAVGGHHGHQLVMEEHRQ
jgi:hypothetical protein